MAERKLTRVFKYKVGNIIYLDPNTGEVIEVYIKMEKGVFEELKRNGEFERDGLAILKYDLEEVEAYLSIPLKVFLAEFSDKLQFGRGRYLNGGNKNDD